MELYRRGRHAEIFSEGVMTMHKYMIRLVFALAALMGLGAAHGEERGTRDEAVAMVKRAVAYIKANGRDKAFAEFNNPNGGFRDRDLYILVYDFNGTKLAHGANPKMMGKNLLELRDADGKYMVKEFIQTANTRGKGWVDYHWLNPATRAVEEKSTYVEKLDDLVIGCGVYK